jgi:hypothetical protein
MRLVELCGPGCIYWLQVVHVVIGEGLASQWLFIAAVSFICAVQLCSAMRFVGWIGT